MVAKTRYQMTLGKNAGPEEIPHPADSPDPTGDWRPDWVPAGFFDSRPLLGLIRDHAKARMIPVDYLLGHVLLRASLTVPPEVRLPALVGATMPLNFGAVFVGAPGTGKTSTTQVLPEIVDDSLRPHEVPYPMGTGEGVVDLFLGSDTDHNDVRLPHYLPRWVHADEGRIVNELVDRAGSTLSGVLCTAVSGGPLGQSNATKDRRRIVPAGAYKVAVSVNMQPRHLDGVLTEGDGGLPQRFLFLTDHAGHIADDFHTWGRFDYPPPAELVSIPTLGLDAYTYNEQAKAHLIGCPDTIRDEVRHAKAVRMVEGADADVMAGHQMLMRLRLAALLAVMEGRTTIDGEDWSLAAMLVATSEAVIEIGEADRKRKAALARQDREQAAVSTASKSAVATAEALDDRALKSLVRDLPELIEDAGGHSTSEGVKRRDVKAGVSSMRRDHLAQAIDLALENGTIEAFTIKTESGRTEHRLRSREDWSGL